jgi:hypothetical protein
VPLEHLLRLRSGGHNEDAGKRRSSRSRRRGVSPAYRNWPEESEKLISSSRRRTEIEMKKRAFLVTLAAALVATSLLAPAEAAKKKKPKKPPAAAPVQTDVTLFLRRDGEDCADAAARFLSLVDAEDIDTGSCGSANYGVREPLGADPMSYATREGDGVPVTLDATKKITGLVGVKSQSQQGAARWGIGSTTLNIELVGSVAGVSKTIGSTTVDYDVEPGGMDQVYEIEFEITPDTALDKTVFESLSLILFNSGSSANHGFYTTDNPASFFKMGAWK